MTLFKRSRHMLSGDVTPAYSALERDEIETLAANHPDSKAVLIICEPVARLWSAFNMYIRQELKSDGLDPDGAACTIFFTDAFIQFSSNRTNKRQKENKATLN